MTEQYVYNVRTLDSEMRGDVLWWLHEESWTTLDGIVVHSRQEWHDKPLKTLAEFLAEMGFDDGV